MLAASSIRILSERSATAEREEEPACAITSVNLGRGRRVMTGLWEQGKGSGRKRCRGRINIKRKREIKDKLKKKHKKKNI